MSKKDQDINELLAEYSKDATHFVASSATIDQMIKEGLKVQVPPPLTNEQYIDRLFRERKKNAKRIAKQLPSTPSIAIPPIISLYDEIRECVLFGLNGAAISLSAILTEFAIKHALIDHTKGTEIYDKKEWDRIESKELGKIISEAAKANLFNAAEIKKLQYFKNKVRNPYLHYNIKRITAGAVMPEVSAYNTESKSIVKQYNLKAEDNPFLWQFAKKKIDEQSVLDIFQFADSVVRRLFGD